MKIQKHLHSLWYFVCACLLVSVVILVCQLSSCLGTCVPEEADSVRSSIDQAHTHQPFFLFQHKSLAYCTGNTLGLGKLTDIFQAWKVSEQQQCRDLHTLVSYIYTVSRDVASISIPSSFLPKVKSWLKNDEELINEVFKQSITVTYNQVTGEGTVFNPLREKRPVSLPKENPLQYVHRMSNETAKSCDFCAYESMTAGDTFGRLELRHAVTIANTFKLDAWHSMSILRTHHPTSWNASALHDLFGVALLWFTKVKSLHPAYKYPVIYWDLMPHASASQVHPHIHMCLSQVKYYGFLQHRWEAAQRYSAEHDGRNYFVDELKIHDGLNLTVRLGKASAYATITAKRDNDLVIISEEPGRDFFQLLYFITRAYLDDLGLYCYSMTMSLPPLNSDGTWSNEMPALARIVTRGTVFEVRTDVSSMELFSASNVNVDPYKTIQAVRNSIKIRSS